MDPTALHLEIRNALALSDELRRHEHALGNDALAGHLSALRTELDDLERVAGKSHEDGFVAGPTRAADLERSRFALEHRSDEVPEFLGEAFADLIASVDRIAFALTNPKEPVRTRHLVRALDGARVVPQDAHSIADYLLASGFALSARFATTTRAKIVGITIASGVTGSALFSDHRLAAAKAIPMDVHEAVDHGAGLLAIAAPFVLGYAKKDPIATAIQVACGVASIALALFTDYRAVKGGSRPRRSRGGPKQTPRDREMQRSHALEGLSAAGTDWRPEAASAVDALDSN